MDAVKQFYEDELVRFESERSDLQVRIARLETDLDKMQHKLLVKDEQITEQKVLSKNTLPRWQRTVALRTQLMHKRSHKRSVFILKSFGQARQVKYLPS